MLHRCMELPGGLTHADCFAALQHEDLLDVDFLHHRLLVLLVCVLQGTGSSNRFLRNQYGYHRQSGFQFLKHTSSSVFHLSISTLLKKQNLFVLDFKNIIMLYLSSKLRECSIISNSEEQ